MPHWPGKTMNTLLPLSLRRFRLNRQPSMPIGVEFGSDALHMVQCGYEGGTMVIKAAASVAYALEEQDIWSDAKALKSMMRRAFALAPFRGRQVHSALPANQVRIVPITLPAANNQSEPEAVLKTLQEKLRLDLKDMVIDYCPIFDSAAAGSEKELIAIVARRDDVFGHLKRLESAGLRPVSVEVKPTALVRLLSAMQQHEQERCLLLINFGVEKTYISVVWGKQLMLDREVAFGQSSLTSRLASSLGMTQDAALSLLQEAAPHEGVADQSILRTIDEILHADFAVLAEEINRTLVYIASKTRGGSAKCMYVNGSLAHYTYIARKLEKLVNVPVAHLQPFKALPMSQFVTVDADTVPSNGLAVAAGLALRG